MGQTSSREPTGEDLLFHVLDNEAVIGHLLSSGTYRHFHSDVSKLREGATSKGSVADAHDYFHDLSDADKTTMAMASMMQNYEVGTKKWWRSYAAAKLSGSSAPERANRLGQLVQDLQEQSGCTKLLKDIIMERRMALLEDEFDKIEGKTDHAQESKFSKLDDVLAKVGGAWSSLAPAGVRVSLTTAIKVVVALLQHTTTSNPALCVTIMDILLDALEQLYPLALHEGFIAYAQATAAGEADPQLRPRQGVLTEGLKIVSQFLASTATTFAHSEDPLARTISTKALEAIVKLAVASGSLSECLHAINLLLTLQKEGKGDSMLAVTESLAQLRMESLRNDIAEAYVAAVSGRMVHQATPYWSEADAWLVAEENKAGLKADQVLVVLLKHLAELAWFALEAVSHKKSALPLVLQFPFVLDLSRSTFELLHGLMAASKAQLLVAHEDASEERREFFGRLLLTCVRLTVRNLRELNLGRIDPSDVGLTNEGPESMVSSLGGLLKGFILDESPRHTDEERQQAALIQALSSEALAVGLDYFVPSRKGQFEIFIDVLKQTTSDEVKTSSQFLLDQLLDYFSSVGTLYRLLQTKEEGSKEDVLNDLLACMFTYSKRQAQKAVADIVNGTAAATEQEQAQAGTQAYVRFLLTLQNCIFCSVINARRKDASAEASGLLNEGTLAAYVVQALAHCEDLVAHVSDLVPTLTPAPQGESAAAGLPPLVGKIVGLLLNDSALALLPALASSLLLLLNSSSSSSSSTEAGAPPPLLGGESGEALVQQLLGFLQRSSAMQKQLGVETDSALNITQKLFTVFTTQHQYSNDMDVTQELVVPDADYTELYFDPQTKTEETHDYLRVYLEPDHCNQLGEQYSGAFHRWPQTPVVIPGGCAWLYFHSDGSNVDWGVRILAVSYYRPRKWLTELQRTLVLLITKLVTGRVDEQHKDEAAWAKWLAAPLFKAGLQLAPAAAAGDSTPQEDQHEAQFLRDFIALAAGPGAELHRKMNRAHLSASALQLSSISSQSVDQALRGVIAALLKHCHLVGDAMAFATSKQSTPSDELKRAYRYGYKIKKWFIQQRQRQASSLTASGERELKKSGEDGAEVSKDLYRPLAEGVLAKAHALLQFRPAFTPHDDDDEDNGATLSAPPSSESRSLRRSMDRLLQQAGLPALVDDDDDDLPRGMAGETRVYGWESTAKAVISFIEAPDVEAAALHELVAVRRRRAEQRAKSLASLDRVLSGCAGATAALPDLLSHVALALAGGARSTGNPKKKGTRAAAAASALVHYSRDLAACGTELEERVSSEVYRVYRRLLAIGEEHQQSAPHVVIALLYALAIRFETEADFQFLASLGIFKWLSLFMAGHRKPQPHEKMPDGSDSEKGKEKEETTTAIGDDDDEAKEKTAERGNDNDNDNDNVGTSEASPSLSAPSVPSATSQPADSPEEVIDDEEMARRLQAQFDAELMDDSEAAASTPTRRRSVDGISTPTLRRSPIASPRASRSPEGLATGVQTPTRRRSVDGISTPTLRRSPIASPRASRSSEGLATGIQTPTRRRSVDGISPADAVQVEADGEEELNFTFDGLFDSRAPSLRASRSTAAVLVEEDDEEAGFTFDGLFGSPAPSLRASRNATSSRQRLVEVGPTIHTVVFPSAGGATSGDEASERKADRAFVKSLFPDEFSFAPAGSESSASGAGSSERQKQFDKQSDCAWSLFQFLALQAIAAPAPANDDDGSAAGNKNQKAGATTLFGAQETLVAEFMELLFARLTDAHQFEGGLGAAEVLIFLHSLSGVAVVQRYLTNDRWLDLLLRFGGIGTTDDTAKSCVDEGEGGKAAFTQVMALELLGGLLPYIDPEAAQSGRAREVVVALLAGAGARLSGGLVRQHLVPSFQLLSSSSTTAGDVQLTHRREVIGRAMLAALARLPSSSSSPANPRPYAAAWARVLAPLALDALREHLPRTLELLALPSSLSPFRGSPSLDLVVAHLSLLGGYQARPLPGVSVQVPSNAQRRGWVVGLRHAKDDQLVVIATDGHSESALNPAEVVVQPDEAEVALVTEVVRAVGPELLQFLPLLAPVNKKPAAATAEKEERESLTNALVLGHVRALFVKALSRHLAADATLCHALLADHPDAVQALLALAVADSSSCGNRQPRAERERALAGLYLRTTDALHGARLPQQDAVARELAEWLGKPESKCAAALGEAANDRLRAFAALTGPESEAESAEHARAQKKLRGDDGPFTVSTADIPTEEFGGILSDFMWTARSYAELDSPNATSGFSDSGSNQPAWFQLLSTTASLVHLYALETVMRLLGHAMEAQEATLEQRRFLALFQDPATLASFCKALISHQAPVSASAQRLVKELIERLHGPADLAATAGGGKKGASGKGKEKDTGPVFAADADEATGTSAGLAALVQEGLVSLEQATKTVGKFTVQKEESTHPYPNTSNYQRPIHLKSASSMVILFDPQCKTENNYDWVRFRWPSQELIREFCGNPENFKHFTIPGNHAILHFFADDSNNFWGYKLWAVGLLNNYPSATLTTENALRMLEFALDIWDNSAARKAASPLHNGRTVGLLLQALKNAINASAKNTAIELLQRLIAHPSMHHQTEVVEQVLDEIEVPMNRLYAVQKNDAVFSQSLQRFIELSVKLYKHLDDSLYDELKWVRVAREDGSLSAPEGLKSTSATTGQPAWKRAYSLDGVRHGANFDGQHDVARFEEGREVELSASKGWSISLWFATPLPKVKEYNTFFTLSNGDKIVVNRADDDEGWWTLGVTDVSEHFTPSSITLKVPPLTSDVKTPTTEITWNYLTVSADPEKAKLNIFLWDSASRRQLDSLDYVRAAGASLKTIGNSAEGGEYCGMLDHVVIRPHAPVLQADDLLPHLHLGLLKANRTGPYTPIAITHRHCRNGEVDLHESQHNLVHVSKGSVSVTLPVSMKAGKWYYEVTLRANSTANARFGWGLLGDANEVTGAGDESWGFDPHTYDKWHNNEQTSFGRQWKEGDVLGVQLDLDSNPPVIGYHLNGESFGPAFSAREGQYRPSITLEAGNKVAFNFGAEPFLFAPEGYQPVDVSAKIPPEESRVGRAKPPFVVRAVMEQEDIIFRFLTRQPLPLLFLEDAMANKEFLLFDPKLGEMDLNDLFFYYLQRSNNDGADWSMERDEQLVQVMNRICAAKDDDPMEVAPESITLTDTIGLQFPEIAALPHTALVARFYVLKRLNLLFKALCNVVDCSRMTANPIPVGRGVALTPAQLEGRGLASLVWHARRLVFFNVKRELGRSICKQTEVGRDPHVFRFNRLKAIKNAKNKANDGLHTLFGQLHTQLDTMADLSVLRQAERGWKVDFQGEGATDQGGPYRESVTQISLELHGEALPLLIPSPNKRLDVGDTREKFVLNPRATSPLHLRLYRTMGVVMGICIRTRGAIDLRLPSLFWKFFVGEETTLGDLEIFDCVSAQFIRNIETQLTSPELFEAVYDDLTFTTTLSDGSKVELKEGGAREVVTFATRLEYLRLILETRLSECTRQLEAVREGLRQIVPVETLKYLTWQEMESLVVGRIDFDVEWLQKRTRYYGSISASHPTVAMLWEVLAEVGPDERAKFLRFVYGQSRLAPSYAGTNLEFTIEALERSGNPDVFLPEAMTCAFKLKLPLYTTKASLKAKLMYAIHNTAEIDSDYVPSTQWDPQDMQASDDDDDEQETGGIAQESTPPVQSPRMTPSSSSAGGLFD